MSIATVLDSVKTAQRERLDAKVDTFEQLVQQVADGAALDPDEVAGQLDQLDLTVEKLATAAQRIVDRREWAAQLVKDAELLAEHNQLAASEQAADAELVEAVRAAKFSHAQRVGPIQSRIVGIAYARDAGQTARNKLIETSPQRQRLSKLCAERASFVIALEGPLQVSLRQAKPADVGFVQGEIQRTQAKVDQLTAEIEQLEREALLP